MTQKTSLPVPEVLVACLCAGWCGTCGGYAEVFASLQPEFPQARFAWVDVEDQAEWVEPVDIENFPTLLLAAGDRVVFFGSVTPHLDTLRRLVSTLALDAHADAAPTAHTQAALHEAAQSLLLRLRQMLAQAS